jgi:hypothetical protein
MTSVAGVPYVHYATVRPTEFEITWTSALNMRKGTDNPIMHVFKLYTKFKHFLSHTTNDCEIGDSEYNELEI